MALPPAALTREEWLTLADSWSHAGVEKCYICGKIGVVYIRQKLIDHYQRPALPRVSGL